MAKCGDCRNFQPVGANPAANTGLCVAIVDEDGLPKPTDLYADAGECPKFDAMDRVRTKTSEFMGDRYLRIARGFDEK